MDKTIGIKTLSSNVAEIYKILSDYEETYDDKIKTIETVITEIEKKLSLLDNKINEILNN